MPNSRPPRIHIGPDPETALVAAVARAGGEPTPLADAEAVVWTQGPPTFPTQLPDTVRWVQLPSAGVEAWLAAGSVDDRRVWTSAAGAYAHRVAEHATLLLLAGVRGLAEQARATAWHATEFDARVGTLRGATVAIVGCGGIGRTMIPLLTAFGARVLAVTRSGTPVPGAAETLGAERTRDIWSRADHVVLAAPATAETAHLVNADTLARMKPTAWLVNVARGALVDTDALVRALRDGAIGGAALDVTDPEPLPDGHPLWTLPNALVTPHLANPAHGFTTALAEHVAANVERFAAGRPLLGVVDTERGY